MKTGLLPLISPLTLEDFRTHFKNNRPFVIHHNENALRELRSLELVSSLDHLLSIWKESVQVHLPDLRDEASAIDVSPTEAQHYFNHGMGILFNDVNRFSPFLQKWVEKMITDLGLSAMTYGRSLIYATPDGKGTSPHFDQNINFVLQISGTKIWTMAKNTSVDNPMVRHTMGQPVDPEMLSYLNESMIEEMPSETESFELRPGSLLFVPRGVWHSTEADGDALSLNFTFSPPTWADLVLAEIRGQLVRTPDWRETAMLESREKLNTLMQSLTKELQKIDVSLN